MTLLDLRVDHCELKSVHANAVRALDDLRRQPNRTGGSNFVKNN